MGGGGLLIFYVTNVSLLHVTLMKVSLFGAPENL